MQRHLRANVISLNATLSSCPWHIAVDLIDGMLEPDVVSVNVLIRSSPKGLKLLKAMSKRQLRADVVTFGALITAEVQWQRGLDYFGEMTRRALEQNVVTLNALISTCHGAALWQHALKLNGLGGNVLTYATVMSTCEKAHLWQEALSSFDSMLRSGLEANVVCYGAAMKACEKGFQWQRALHLFDEMERSKMNPDSASFNAAIGALMRVSHWPLALRFYDRMAFFRVRPDVFSYELALCCCEIGQQFEKALRLLDGVQKLFEGLLSQRSGPRNTSKTGKTTRFHHDSFSLPICFPLFSYISSRLSTARTSPGMPTVRPADVFGPVARLLAPEGAWAWPLTSTSRKRPRRSPEEVPPSAVSRPAYVQMGKNVSRSSPKAERIRDACEASIARRSRTTRTCC